MVSKQNKSSNFNEVGVSWWFVFKDIEGRWFNKFLKKGFQHCFAVTRMNNLVLGVEPLMGAVNMIVTDDQFVEMLARYKMEGYTVVHFRIAPNSTKFKMRGPILTCASYLAYTIGLPFYGVTAHQLYKKLMKLGGDIV